MFSTNFRRKELSIKGQERRVDLELLSLKSAQRNNVVRVRWVHSEAQLGNALTKSGAKELEMFYQMGGTWRIVNDPKMRSARKRRSEGMETFEGHTEQHNEHKTYMLTSVCLVTPKYRGNWRNPGA